MTIRRALALVSRNLALINRALTLISRALALISRALALISRALAHALLTRLQTRCKGSGKKLGHASQTQGNLREFV